MPSQAQAQAQSAAFWSELRKVPDWNKSPSDKTITTIPKVTLESILPLFSRDLFCQVVSLVFPKESEEYDQCYEYWMEHHAIDDVTDDVIPSLPLKKLIPLVPRKAFSIFSMAYSRDSPEYALCYAYYADHHAEADDEDFKEMCKNLVSSGPSDWDLIPSGYTWWYENGKLCTKAWSDPNWDLIPSGHTWWFEGKEGKDLRTEEWTGPEDLAEA